MTRSDIIPMVLFAAIVVSLGINTPQAADEIIARLFGNDISNSELQPEQGDVDRFQTILSDMSEKDVRQMLVQRALGEKITESVLADFAAKNSIEPSATEVESAYSAIKVWTAELTDNSEYSREEIDAYRRAMANAMAKSWKTSKALYETYGGDVVVRQDNPLTPVGAYKVLLEQYNDQGDFTIFDPKLKAAFWESVSLQYANTVPYKNINFTAPWWEQSAGLSE